LRLNGGTGAGSAIRFTNYGVLDNDSSLFNVNFGEWSHIAATYNRWVARLYADGVEVCSRWTWGALAMPEVPFTLSGYLDDSGEIVDEITGRLDDVRIYARALSATEIRQVAGLEAPATD
jgi:hypothetical protein